MRRFIHLYPGTAAARLAEVDAMGRQQPASARVEALERFARSHPGTVEGAKALYQAASDWAHNLPEDKKGEEPSGRFARVVSMARNLQSGAWPASEWVTRAPSLVTQFSAYEPRHSPEGIRAMLDLYREFIASQFALDEHKRVPVAYLINNRIPELLRAGGDASLAGMEPLFEEWARIPGRRDAVRFARAQMFQEQSQDRRAPDHVMWRARTIGALTELAAGEGLYARKALATLASLYFRERDFATAAKTHAKYLALYPRIDWVWAARLRLGQSHEELGDWSAASAAYRRAASADNPVARVLGFANAARSEQALGNYAEALRLYKSAREAWDPAYGAPYRPPSYVLESHMTAPGHVIKSAAPISYAALEAMIARLEIATSVDGGDLLERGRWLIEYSRWLDAREAFDRFLTRYPRSPHSRDARYLQHVAQLSRALDLADVEGASPNHAPARRMLDQIAQDPWDPAVGLSRIASASLLVAADPGEAHSRLRSALEEWRREQSPPPESRSDIEQDVSEIRKLVFRPAGGDPYSRERRWEAFPPQAIRPFIVVQPELPVALRDGTVTAISAFSAQEDVTGVIFMSAEHIEMLGRIVEKIGGTRTREPVHVMEVPHQPIGGAREIVALWDKLFEAHPGHWGGWIFETAPVIDRVEFLDHERTRAAVKVRIRYEGVTVVVEKVSGVWKVVKLTNRWIT